MEIEKMTESELLGLKEKILQREKEIKENKKNKEVEKTKKFLDLIDKETLLSVMSHSRHSCTEGKSLNGYISSQGYADCQKCHFIDIIEDHEVGINDFSVEINFTFKDLNK
jgi:hypothetical protein